MSQQQVYRVPWVDATGQRSETLELLGTCTIEQAIAEAEAALEIQSREGEFLHAWNSASGEELHPSLTISQMARLYEDLSTLILPEIQPA